VLFAVCYYGDKIKDDELGRQKGIMVIKLRMMSWAGRRELCLSRMKDACSILF